MSKFDTTTARPQTLFDIAGIQARIHTLPDRPPFILDADAAEVYRSAVKKLNQAVKRNPRRFRDKDCFRLTEEETALMWSQSVTTSQGSRRDLRPLAFTHSGAYAISFVLTSDVAIEMGHVMTDAFAATEAAAAAQAQKELLALHSQITGRRSLYSHLRDAFREGRSFQEVKDETRRSFREIMEKMATVMINCGRSEPLRGTPMKRFQPVWQRALNPEAALPEEDAADPRQIDMFGEG